MSKVNKNLKKSALIGLLGGIGLGAIFLTAQYAEFSKDKIEQIEKI